MFCSQQPRMCNCTTAKQHSAPAHPAYCKVQARAVSRDFRLQQRSTRSIANQVFESCWVWVSSPPQRRHCIPTFACALQTRVCTSCTASSSHCHPNIVDRLTSGLLAVAAAASISLAVPAPSALAGELQPFLSSTGALLSVSAQPFLGEVQHRYCR